MFRHKSVSYTHKQKGQKTNLTFWSQFLRKKESQNLTFLSAFKMALGGCGFSDLNPILIAFGHCVLTVGGIWVLILHC